MHIRKAGLSTCLFFCVTAALAQNHAWFTSPQQRTAYQMAWQLQTAEARVALSNQHTAPAYYVATFAEALELLITEDENRFEQYEEAYLARIDWLEQQPTTADNMFTLAELRMQWAFVYLKFGHEMDAAWNIRQANQRVQTCLKKFPDYQPIKKTSGLLNVILGAVPEKFQWVLSLLNMTGSIEQGLQELTIAAKQIPDLALESELMHHLVYGFLLQESEAAMKGLDKLREQYPNNRLLLFLGASVAIKNSSSEQALALLNDLDSLTSGLPLPYAQYLKGEVFLHKGAYQQSIESYQRFLQQYSGLNYKKDAWYKTGLCYWLMNEPAQVNPCFEKARAEGKEAVEADKYAARSLAEGTLPVMKLARIRYATDGGYYDEAMRVIRTVQEQELITVKDKAEFAYRKARLHHKLLQPEDARREYLSAVALTADHPWYFAPNACLQLGYLALENNNTDEARKFFEQALRYKRHEYKNSIDSKAKSALASLNKKKK